MSSAKKVTVANGGAEGNMQPRRRAVEESEQLICPECNSSFIITALLGPRRSSEGEIVGGIKTMVCAVCFAEGEIIELGKVH